MVKLVAIAVNDSSKSVTRSILHSAGNLLSSAGLGGSWCLLRHAVSLDTLGLSLDISLLLARVDIDLVGSALSDEFGQVLDGTRTTVVKRVILTTSAEELDGWEALNLIWNIVGSCVNLGNRNLG